MSAKNYPHAKEIIGVLPFISSLPNKALHFHQTDTIFIVRNNWKKMIQVIPIPAFDDNYLWLFHNNGNAAVVDPGDAVPVLKSLQQNDLTLTHILVTHHHMDHIGGIRKLKEKFPKALVYGPACGRIPCIDKEMHQGDIIDLKTLGKYKVIDVPGHTRSHIAYFGEGALFIGDTVFASGSGRLFEGTPAQMVESFEKIKQLPLGTKIYCAHEYTLSNLKFALAVDPNNSKLLERDYKCQQLRLNGQPTVPFTLEEELQTSPFFRYNTPEIQKAVTKRNQREITSPIETFAAIRSWKDTF
jgi:hydroxyacylglutathione hydrolase